MTKRLEALFEFDQLDQVIQPDTAITVEETRTQLAEINATIDKIDAALPTVRELETGDRELDELATKAQETFDNLMDLGMNVDSRFSSEIFAVASTMLGHALTAKTAKLNKKLKMVDLQLKKLKLDQDAAKNAPEDAMETAHGQVLSRNDLLERLISGRPKD
jgi:Tfp pilus assembly protein PilO